MSTVDLAPLDSFLDPDRLSPRRLTGVYLVFTLFLLAVSNVLLPTLLAGLGPPSQSGLVLSFLQVGLTAGLVYYLTERMATRLHRSEQRYRNLIETSPAPINLFDEEGSIVWGNDATLELLDLEERDELVGRSIFDFIEVDDHELATSELTDVVEDGQRVGPTQMQLRTAEGERKQIRVSTAPGQYRGDRIGQAVVIDTTAVRETEEALRSERDFIRNALDELRDLFYVVDDEGTLQRWNALVPEVTGYDGDELGETDITAFFGPEDQDRILDALGSTLEQGTTFVEADLQTGDGSQRRYEFKSSPLADPGESDRVVGIGRDVTERRRIERERSENEQRYRTLVEMSPHSILVHRDGEVMYANDALVKLVGADERSQVVGSHLSAFVSPEEYDDVATVAAQTQRGEYAPTDNRRTVVGLDGRERYIETTSRPIAYGDEPAVLTIIKDVSHRHRFAEMLATLHERTQSMTRAETRQEMADIAARTATELLEVESCCVYEFVSQSRLEPLACDGFDPETGEDVSVGTTGEGALWDAFVDGRERTVVDDEALDGRSLPDGSSLVAMPLDNHGVLALVDEEETEPDTARRRVLDLVAENLTAAFDRFEQERDLHERDRRLEEQNESLEQLNRLNEIIREINQSLVRSTSRNEILDETCERITAVEQYTFAWVGDRGSEDAGADPSHWTGVDPEYIDHIGAEGTETPLTRLIEAAFREGTVQVAQDILDEADWQSARSEAISYGFQSVAAVPISTGDYVDSVLVIHARDPDIFDAQERAVLDELGRTIGFALRTIEQTTSSQSGTRTELELSIGDERLITNRITAELEATVEFVGAVPREGDTLHLFIEITDVATDEIADRVAALETVTGVRGLSTDDERWLYHVTVSDSPLVGILDSHGVQIRSLTADAGVSTLVGVLPESLAVRTVFEEIEARYPDTELVARREGPDPVTTQVAFRERLLDRLTERQREAIQTAAYSGFYEWPRETKSKELAEMLGIASSTYQYHLRAAERTIVTAVLEPAGADAL
jgi:PAS domain S-box-containing protein